MVVKKKIFLFFSVLIVTLNVRKPSPFRPPSIKCVAEGTVGQIET